MNISFFRRNTGRSDVRANKRDICINRFRTISARSAVARDSSCADARKPRARNALEINAEFFRMPGLIRTCFCSQLSELEQRVLEAEGRADEAEDKVRINYNRGLSRNRAYSDETDAFRKRRTIFHL